jgi:hypothetical protein
MKSELLQQIRADLRDRYQRLAKAAMDAHAAASDPDSKAEGKYDTRSLEASYLAAGQSRLVDELGETVRLFEAFSPPDLPAGDLIGMGTLVEADIHGETSLFLLAPAAGGMVVNLHGQEVTLLTPASALYQQLLGRSAGDYLEDAGLLVIEVS